MPPSGPTERADRNSFQARSFEGELLLTGHSIVSHWGSHGCLSTSSAQSFAQRKLAGWAVGIRPFGNNRGGLLNGGRQRSPESCAQTQLNSKTTETAKMAQIFEPKWRPNVVPQNSTTAANNDYILRYSTAAAVAVSLSAYFRGSASENVHYKDFS